MLDIWSNLIQKASLIFEVKIVQNHIKRYSLNECETQTTSSYPGLDVQSIDNIIW